MGRRKTVRGKRHNFAVRVDDKMYERIMEVCKKRGITPSDFFRELLTTELYARF